ncbi:hypothetical protein C5167_000175 [Papaver somniferum]|uniref:Uncharacterized protein n=1 Tax=Papaver somniferum TaxID=3469 RepID=A0A4Y7KVX6_PAPSO|nr:hypothetical protein C5167_000175 [Papaver somniferum]
MEHQEEIRGCYGLGGIEEKRVLVTDDPEPTHKTKKMKRKKANGLCIDLENRCLRMGYGEDVIALPKRSHTRDS